MTRARWVLFAYHTFGARALQALLRREERVLALVTHEDDPAEGGWFESAAEIARAHGVPVFTPTSPDLPALREVLAALEADLFLSVWYRRLLGAELLTLPKVAALNLHGSLLPRYRGRAPLNWVLVNGERLTGVTLHHMTTEADAGDIVAQEPIPIDPEDTALTLYRRMVKVGVDLLVRSFPGVLDGTAPRIPQDHTRATVCARRRPEDGRVHWEWPAERIANMIHAVTHPFPGAFVGDGAHRLWLWAGTVERGRSTSEAPGTVLDVRPGPRVAVATGEGVLAVTSVQTAGAPEEPAEGWASRLRLEPGTRLGR